VEKACFCLLHFCLIPVLLLVFFSTTCIGCNYFGNRAKQGKANSIYPCSFCTSGSQCAGGRPLLSDPSTHQKEPTLLLQGVTSELNQMCMSFYCYRTHQDHKNSRISSFSRRTAYLARLLTWLSWPTLLSCAPSLSLTSCACSLVSIQGDAS